MKEIYVANIKGETGNAATVRVGSVTTLPPGSEVLVENVGTQYAAILNFAIPEGEGFKIDITYPSIEAMNAGFASDNVRLYGFALIDTGNVEDEENARLYVKGQTTYQFLTDMSGAQGIKGETGAKGEKGENGESIAEIVYVETTASEHVFRAVLTDGTSAGTFSIPVTEITADKVILKDDIVLAGDYVQVGNVSKGSQTATSTFSAKGKTVAQVLQEIFTKRLQPKIVKSPSVNGFTFSMAGRSVEVGTNVSSLTVGTLNLDKGAYTYDTDTGVSVSGFSIKRIINGIETEVSTDSSFTDTNSGNGFTIGDNGSVTYKGQIIYTQGNIATDNLGEPSDPPVRIAAGTATSATLPSLTGYRNYFYGAVTTASPPTGAGITSAMLRGLTKSGRAYSATSVTVNVPKGATAVYMACVAAKTGVTRVFNENNQQDITGVFTKQQNVSVEGANGYTAANYNVWFYIPAVPFENDTRLIITLG